MKICGMQVTPYTSHLCGAGLALLGLVAEQPRRSQRSSEKILAMSFQLYPSTHPLWQDLNFCPDWLYRNNGQPSTATGKNFLKSLFNQGQVCAAAERPADRLPDAALRL